MVQASSGDGNIPPYRALAGPGEDISTCASAHSYMLQAYSQRLSIGGFGSESNREIKCFLHYGWACETVFSRRWVVRCKDVLLLLLRTFLPNPPYHPQGGLIGMQLIQPNSKLIVVFLPKCEISRFSSQPNDGA